MDQIIDRPTENTPNGKIYKDSGITLGTFLGGPLVAGYLMAENFKKLGKEHLVSQTWIFTIIFSAGLIAILLLIPDDINVPNMIFPIMEVLLVRYLFNLHQKEDAETYVESGGEYYGWGRVVIISIIGFALTIAAIFFTVLFF
ncbi:hypothetical protein [Fulvivirga sediminis]|uniref:Uncharacterized protein n=1 Tax=Fulvivirga sediminis TaxID=2803949 RepID=A0A937FCQ0_9BACT|nr:hypothetical protein [Fulvivirga sediminis]MBL3658369.1 hypothetical protein [Fulvivirga sediminis]